MSIQVADEEFRRAINLIDAGNCSALKRWLDSHPRLLSDAVPLTTNQSGDYFAQPKLLWFIAENPVRTGTLPANIVDITELLIALTKQAGVTTLQEDLVTTLALVASGRIARETGHQQQLLETLTQAGADPNGAVLAALGHRETTAASHLLRAGAKLTLCLAAGLNRINDVIRQAPKGTRDDLQEALTIAAFNGHADIVAILLRHGADPVPHNPNHLHPHATPLHVAIDAGSLETVKVLIAAGANIQARDKIHGATATNWARHFGRDEILAFLERLGEDGALVNPSSS